jgi:hypothetical protein
VILLHKTLDDYVTLFQVYEHVINPDKLRVKIAEGDQRFSAKNRRVFIDKATYLSPTALRAWTWHEDASGSRMWAHWSVTSRTPDQPTSRTIEDQAPAADELHRPPSSKRSTVVRGRLDAYRAGSARPSSRRQRVPLLFDDNPG